MSLHCRPAALTLLTNEEGSRLGCYIDDMADMGFGLSREDVMCIVYLNTEKSGPKHLFTN